MKVKVTNGQIIEGNSVMMRLAAGITDAPVRYAILLNGKAIEPILDTYNTVRQSLIDKYAAKDDDGKAKTTATGIVVWREGEEDALKAELDELNAIENEVSIRPLTIEKLASVINYNRVDPSVIDVVDGDKVLKYEAIDLITWMLE